MENGLSLCERIFACSRCKGREDDEKVHYHQKKSPKIAIILQNPGPINNKKDAEAEKEELKTKTHEEKARHHTRQFKRWLLDASKGNLEFFQDFFNLLSQYNIVEDTIGLIDDYVKTERIFEDVFFTDAAKCRAKTGKIKSGQFKTCIDAYMMEELSELPNLKYVFVFSTRAWEKFYKKFKPISEQNKTLNNFTVAKAHGYVFKINLFPDNNYKEAYVIPLTHMSPVHRNVTLRNSYFDYLEDGLKWLSENNKFETK